MNLVVQCWCSAYGAHQTIESRRAILQFACKYILLSRILRTLPREIDETSLPFRLSYPVSSVLFIRRLCLILFKDIPIKRPWKFPLWLRSPQSFIPLCVFCSPSVVLSGQLSNIIENTAENTVMMMTRWEMQFAMKWSQWTLHTPSQCAFPLLTLDSLTSVTRQGMRRMAKMPFCRNLDHHERDEKEQRHESSHGWFNYHWQESVVKEPTMMINQEKRKVRVTLFFLLRRSWCWCCCLRRHYSWDYEVLCLEESVVKVSWLSLTLSCLHLMTKRDVLFTPTIPFLFHSIE